MHELHFSQEALPCQRGRAEDIRRGRLEVIPPYRPDFNNLSFTLQDTFTDGGQPPAGFTHCFDITEA